MTVVVRVAIHVRPGASHPGVGGTHDGALVVRVAEAPQDGAATRAALKALARAVGVPVRSLAVEHGAGSRRKLIAVTVPSDRTDAFAQRLDELRIAASR